MYLPQRNDNFVKELLKKEENIELDFKLSISNSSKIARTLVAFANTKGGTIAIGINDHKKIIGIDPEEELFMIKKAAEEYCIPPVLYDSQVYEIEYLDDEKLEEELLILVINVPKSENEHLLLSKGNNRLRYLRVGDKNIPQ
ncbi:AlbA family DNA-binding domain-containing protein [Belliella aquatica]|uniref:Schlafen AlbA-2 domain-containing protein n=1 Tax=Belliella aquatica TaxID=1323734 RepID=A0ABQ1MTQ4_9BACT|nr:ATP-binding protein [Belliella aquatica]MCH7406420.1 ATP-binding protein [Belliella aquatica]GGC45899.1 hypothetical protein GCM10010993_25580 [Belliella aquatica]